MILWVKSPYYKSPSCQVWWSQACAREEISFFIDQVTARDFVVRESCNVMGEFPLSLVSTLQSLVIIDLFKEEISSFQFVT